MRMKRSGRTSIVIIVTVALVAGVIGLFLLAGESPTGVAGRFLTSLAKGDTKTLASLSYMGDLPPDKVEEAWKNTYEVSKYWKFAYSISGSNEQDSNNATVKLQWVKGADNPSAFEEKYELPLVKKDGKWLVDVRGISRDMYPALPR
jgi:hypothetical protein